MNVDIRTLAIVIVIVNCLQAIALILQYMLNRTYKGVGWWALGCSSLSIGFIFLLMRDIVKIELPAIFFANIVLLAGHIFLYIGTTRFLGKKENCILVVSVSGIFLILTFYVIFVSRNDNLRAVILYLSAAVIIYLHSKSLFVYKTRTIMMSANFTAAVFFIYGCFFILRSIAALTVYHIENVFIPGSIQVSAFLSTLTAGILTTFGFIIMVNQRLNADSREDKERFELIFENSPDATIITRASDGLVVSINEGFTLLTGYTRDEIIGRLINEINLWSDVSDRQKALHILQIEGICKNYECIFRMKNSSKINAILSGKIIDFNNVPYILSVIHDITDRKNAENKIKALLEEKVLILKEVHHRIKNNMNTVNSLLVLQSEFIEEPAAKAALADAGSRVRSMMVLYEKLYLSDNFQYVSATQYISSLIDEIIKNFPNSRSVKIVKRLDDFVLDVNRIQPFGIIINELLTNIMKYAFIGRSDGVITVTASLKNKSLCFILHDNGIGIPESIDFKNSTGFGLLLVEMLAKQLNCSLKIEREDGTKIVMEFEV